jgi:hypothetical protein
MQGAYGRARALIGESLAQFREAGDRYCTSEALVHLGLLARLEGDFREARALLAESVSSADELGMTHIRSRALGQLGVLRIRIEQDHAGARRLLEEGLASYQNLGDTAGIGYTLSRLGNLARAAGDRDRARGLYAESLARFRESTDARQLAACLNFCGCLAVDEGRAACGVRLFAAADGLDACFRASLDPAERAECETSLAAARGALGEDDFVAAWAEGQVLSLDEAIAEATTWEANTAATAIRRVAL